MVSLMSRLPPRRDQAYFYWATLGPLGAHALYCRRLAWGLFELALAAAALASLALAQLRLEALWAAALALDPAAFERPLSLIGVGSTLWLRAGLACLAANTLCWAADAWLIRRWTRPQA